MRIVDYSHGHTGSAHDATAFQGTCAYKHPEYMFSPQEFSWVDSAYPLSCHTLPIHKRPASLEPDNIAFDKVASHLRVRSEHCMGALKGRFQCLRGLRVHIKSVETHIEACRWITIAIILHNFFVEVEGAGENNEIFLEDYEEHCPNIFPNAAPEDEVNNDAVEGEAK